MEVISVQGVNELALHLLIVRRVMELFVQQVQKENGARCHDPSPIRKRGLAFVNKKRLRALIKRDAVIEKHFAVMEVAHKTYCLTAYLVQMVT